MTSKDKRTNRPSEGEDTPPGEDTLEERGPEVAPETSAAEAAAGAAPPVPRRRSTPPKGKWSPPTWPQLEIDWTGMPNERESLDFTVIVALDARGLTVTGPTQASRPRTIVVETTLSAAQPVVPFSVRDERAPRPFLSGVLRYESSADLASLSVSDLRYPGSPVPSPLVILYPREPAASS